MSDGNLPMQAAVLFGTAIAVAWLFRVLRLPGVIGFLLTGLIIGPHGVGLFEQDDVMVFAEVGLVLLLFVVGIELSPAALVKAGPRLAVAVTLQIGVIMAVAMAGLLAFGSMPWAAALLLAFALTNSSTPIVLKTLADRDEMQTSMGRLCTGFSLLQDVSVIVIMVILPFLAPAAAASGNPLLRAAGAFAAFAAIILVTRRVLPTVLTQLTRFGGPELTTLFAVTMAAGGAGVAGLMNWPLSLGACVAGLLLAEADLRHQLAAEITPFRDVFNALFFISMGMLVDLELVATHAGFLGAAIVGVLLLKAAITTASIRAAGWPLRLAVQGGIGLCTVSEFAYVLAMEASHLGLMPRETLQMLVPVAVGTMIVGAFFLPQHARIAHALAGGGRGDGPGGDGGEAATPRLRSHVIILGYGVNGQNLAAVLRATHVPHCVVEMNRALAQRAQADGATVVVGDAARMAILGAAGLDNARALVIAINDPEATRRIVGQVRHARPDLYVLARTDSVDELDALYGRGANVVVPSDFEVSIKIFAHVLTEMRIPDNVIQAQIAAIRAGGYGMLRGVAAGQHQNLQELLEVFRLTATQTHYVGEDSPMVGKTLAEINLRQRTGATIIAVVRDGHATTNPAADHALQFGDVLVLLGSHAQLDATRTLLEKGRHAPRPAPDA